MHMMNIHLPGQHQSRAALTSRYMQKVVTGLIILVVAGCASAPAEKPRGPVFYPPLPNPPYVQYLTTLSTAQDAGEELSSFAQFILGSDTEQASLVTKPYGVDMHEGKVYVVDTRGPGYAIFDLVNKRFEMVMGQGSGSMNKPINISIDNDGYKYITDTQRRQILVFDKNDKYQRAYGVKGQFQPSDVLVHEDKLYVADIKQHQIHVLDKKTGKTLKKFGSVGSAQGELFYPTNIALSPDNKLYVSETGNFRVQIFSLEGDYIGSFGKVGTSVGHFARPKGIAIDNDGRIYVVDAAFENVQIFDDQAKLLLSFGGSGNNPENINLPAGIHLDYDNAALFQKYAEPDFKIEYIILVASQFGLNKVNVYGFGQMQGMDYSIGQTDNDK